MIRRVSEVTDAFARRWVPDPFVLAIVLTAVTFAVCLVLGEGSFGERARTLAEVWGSDKGIWNPGLMVFGFQMILVLVTGHALASTRAVRAVIDRLAGIPRGTASAAGLVAAVALLAGLINWGLGLIVGALFARQVGARCKAAGIRVHYPLIVAAGYVGLMAWHGGLSGSAPLKVATDAEVRSLVGDATVEVEGAEVSVPERLEALQQAAHPGRDPELGAGIPVRQTVFSATNGWTAGLLLVCVPAFFAFMAPKRDEVEEIPEEVAQAATGGAGGAEVGATPAERLERSGWVAGVLVGLAAAHLGLWVWAKGGGVLDALNLNTINLAFFAVGLALHGSPKAYAEAFGEAIQGTTGVVLQFPIYFGIMGLMASSGLVQALAEGMVRLSAGSEGAFAVLTFLSAGVVNVFVPSGGGQWAVQGPVVLSGAAALGVDPSRAVLALAYGDQWTNMLQPFWALPLLGICGVRARDILGYTVVVMVLSAPLFLIPLTLL